MDNLKFTRNLNLNDMSKVKEFVSIAQNITEDVVLRSGKFAVNGKSIMGVFSLDLSKPITLEIEPSFTTTVSDMSKISEKISQFECVD